MLMLLYWMAMAILGTILAAVIIALLMAAEEDIRQQRREREELKTLAVVQQTYASSVKLTWKEMRRMERRAMRMHYRPGERYSFTR